MIIATLSLVACNKQDSEKPEHTHSFGEWEVTKNPTCTEDGAKVRYCSCGEKQNEIVVALGHTPADATVENKVDPTYEADGSYNEVVRCATCNEKLSETPHVIPMLKHTPADAVEENRVEATCYSEGSYDTVVYCSDCGVELERTKNTIGKIEHIPATAVEENFVDSTCYSVGSKDMVIYCSIAECCKELERSTETIIKKAHTSATAVEENRVEPTFEQDGSYQLVVYCSVAECHEELERTTHTLDMLVHHPGSVVIENEVAATCTKTGSYDEVVYCLDDNCNHKELSRKTITVSMIAHTNGAAVEENRTNATCYAEGSYDSVVYCSVCNTELSRNKVTLQKIAHSPAEAVVENLVNATCTTDGSYDEVVYCNVENCKVQISRTTKVIAAAGHIYENGTCTICGCLYYSEGLEYTSNGDGTCYVSGIGSCSDTNVVIPSTSPSGDKVIGVGDSAFYGCEGYRTFVIPEGVTYIGQHAFANSNIRGIDIPSTVSEIGRWAFYGCTTLSYVNISDIASWCKIDFAYTDSNPITYAKKIYLNNNLVTNLILPPEVSTIGKYAFNECRSITTVVIDGNVTTIDWDAFWGCSNITSVFYTESEENWNAITIGSNNASLLNATRYYYSETAPTVEGNFWHYVDGVPTPWPEYVAPYVRDGNYIYFGEYPQTIKADGVTVTSTTDDRGYYLGNDGNYYAKVTANPSYSDYTFSTGADVTRGTVYYFKVEPIRWRILSEENGEAFILCDSIIAGHSFDDDDSNNYAESEIRAWLNSTFYETAFNALQQSLILITEVDNDAVSTGYDDNPYVCKNTLDKVFLLSCAEATNSYYGFCLDKYELDVARRMLTSDYSRANGIWMNTSSSYYGGGYWWLRSPYAHISTNALAIGAAGSVVDSNFSNENGIVPALRIRL